MLWPYARSRAARRDPALIDRWLPPGARRLERHAIGSRAEPGSALAALAGVRLRDVPIVGALLAMRGIGSGRR